MNHRPSRLAGLALLAFSLLLQAIAEVLLRADD